jgi:FMN-dependent NADH-azoreductase
MSNCTIPNLILNTLSYIETTTQDNSTHQNKKATRLQKILLKVINYYTTVVFFVELYGFAQHTQVLTYISDIP